MENKEIDMFNFPEEWLNAEGHHGDSNANLLCIADYEMVSKLYKLGNTKAVDSYLDMIWGAWDTMQGLVQCYDWLFISDTEKTDTRKLMANLFEHIELPLIDSTSELDYKYDPNNECDSRIDGFGYGLRNELKPIFVY